MALDGSKQYDMIVLGATGYTGQLCAEHVVKSLPTDLRWAIAGRSEAKLSALTKLLTELNSDRVPNGPSSQFESLQKLLNCKQVSRS